MGAGRSPAPCPPCRKRQITKKKAKKKGRGREPDGFPPPCPACRKSQFTENHAQKVFARLFQKAVGSSGQKPLSSSAEDEIFSKRAQEGRKTSRWDVLRWGNPRRESSRCSASRRIRLPYLCILLFTCWFFDRLKAISLKIDFF